MSRGVDIVLIGGSAGSLQVIIQLLKDLKSDFPFPIFIIIHRKSNDENLLEDLLQRYTKIPVRECFDKMPITSPGIYLVPANYHLLFESRSEIALDVSEKINYSRPSIDVTFRSAGEVFGSRVIAILLSGANADGTEGLRYVQKEGGQIWVQEPDSAEVPYMPRSATTELSCDEIIPGQLLSSFVNNLTD